MKGPIEILGPGSGKMFALIAITYPEGSACTCTSGSKTLKAKDKSGRWLCAVPSEGEWKVSAVLDGQTAEQTISITHKGQYEEVTLSHHLYLFKEGVGLNEDYALSFGTTDYTSVTADGLVWSTNNGSGNALMFTQKFGDKIDCSAYSKLCFELTCGTRNANSASYNVVFGVSNNPVRGTNYVDGFVAQTSKIWDTSRKTYNLSLDGANGSYYVLMAAYATTGTIHNVWLEK